MTAIAAARQGKTSVILERTRHIGGLPANGLGATDIATREATTGLFLEFTSRIKRYYADRYGENSQQLKDCSDGFHFEPSVATTIYQDMSTIAKDEGYPEIAMFFQNLASVEKEHEARYALLLERIKNDQVFKDNAKTVWVCRNCGHVHVGEVPPEACPVCKHPKAYFERKATNY